MRIAIDYTAAIRQGAGIGVYVRNLVNALLSEDKDNQYTLINSGRLNQQQDMPRTPNVRERSLYIPDRYLNILWYRWRLPIPPAGLFTGPADIYHGPDFVLPPLGRRVRKVVTVHDLAFLEHPEYAVPSLAAYLRKVVPEAVQAADVVITLSSEVNRTLREHFATPAEKLVTVPLGYAPHMHRITDPILLAATRHKFELQEPFILAVGTLEPRKNHAGLIRAFHLAQQNGQGPATLAIAGGKGWLYEETQQLVSKLKLDKKVRFLGRVTDYELVTLYSAAEMLAFPSFFEGFGIPPLEAMACGTPVITSNVSSMPEVVGDAALLVDPHSSEMLAEAIIRLHQDASLRAELQQKGYQRVQRLTWQKTAHKTLHIYQQLYKGEGHFTSEDSD